MGGIISFLWKSFWVLLIISGFFLYYSRPFHQEINAFISSKYNTVIQSIPKAVLNFTDSLWCTDANDYAVIFNEYRTSNNLPPLAFTDDLNRMATLRLGELHTDFSHNSKGGYNYHLAENIVKGTSSNQDSFSCWVGSSGHLANIENPKYITSGYAADGYYAVQLFSSWPTINGVPQLPPGYSWPKPEISWR